MAKNPDKMVWQSSKKDPYLTVRETPAGFVYAERLGVDSVAFILYDKNKKGKFGMITELKNPLHMMMTTAFGGSMDKPGVGARELTKLEVKEESGYDVSLDRIKYIGSKLCSTQMNQLVYLFLVDVSDIKAGKKKPQNKTERKAKVVWMNTDLILQGDCMKAASIIAFFNRFKLK